MFKKDEIYSRGFVVKRKATDTVKETYANRRRGVLTPDITRAQVYKREGTAEKARDFLTEHGYTGFSVIPVEVHSRFGNVISVIEREAS